MDGIPKLLIGGGLLLLLLGLILWGLQAVAPQIKFGQLPGDIAMKKGSMTLYVPITTMIVLSLGLTLVMWLIGIVTKR